jgi:hypothetical protein
MRGRMVMVFAIAALAGSLLATDVQARGGGEDGGGSDGFRGNHFSRGFGGTPGDGYGGYGDRGGGLRSGFRGYGGGDVWGQWGAYYGPMIPTM